MQYEPEGDSPFDQCYDGWLHGVEQSQFRRFSREDVERMRREMLGTYASATEIPEETSVDVRGRVVDGELL